MEMTENPEVKPLNQVDTDTQVKKSKPKPPFSVFLELLSDSVVTGVPQIITVRSVVRKIFKTIILCACFAGFIYQAVKFIELYTTYPSSLEVELKYSKSLPEPAVTICNKNPIQKTPYCKDFPEKCSKPTNLTSFCDEYPDHCNHNTTVDDLEYIINDKSLFDEDIIAKYHQGVESFINTCCVGLFGFTNSCRGNSKSVKYKKENGKKQYCTIIDFAYFDTESTMFMDDFLLLEEGRKTCVYLSPFEYEQKYTIVVNLDPEEYTRPDRTVAAQAVIHAYNDFKNPFATGFMMKVGKRYIVTLKAFEEHLLPAPYATNCTENNKLHKDYNREVCLRNCTLNTFMEYCHCIPTLYSAEGLPECDLFSSFDCLKFENEEFCLQQCPRPCNSFYFQYAVSESDIEVDFEGVDLQDDVIRNNILEEDLTDTGNSHFDIDGKVILDIIYDSKEVTTFTYKPKYEQIEILGYIGGFIGIWLGLNLVAVFDFFESVIVFIWWLIHSPKKD